MTESNQAQQTDQRKSDHIRINLDENVQFNQLTTQFEHYFFLHQALPDLNLTEIDTTLSLFNRHLQSPLLISSMTGGTAEARRINQILAEAAQELKISMGLGSQRAAIEDPSLATTYQIRRYAPDILLFANIGAVQLNYKYGIDQCRRAVDMAEADALILHFNALQEAVQPEGDTNFTHLLDKVAQICDQLDCPVIAKEVGWGFDYKTAQQLAKAGVAAIDVAGAGGTSWSQVEMYRAETKEQAAIAAAFIDWGIPTAVALQLCNQAAPQLPIFASGGLKNGIDVAKSIALGATLAGFAGEFLRASTKGTAAVVSLAETYIAQLRITMFASGAKNLTELSQTRLYTDYNELL